MKETLLQFASKFEGEFEIQKHLIKVTEEKPTFYKVAFEVREHDCDCDDIESTTEPDYTSRSDSRTFREYKDALDYFQKLALEF